MVQRQVYWACPLPIVNRQQLWCNQFLLRGRAAKLLSLAASATSISLSSLQQASFKLSGKEKSHAREAQKTWLSTCQQINLSFCSCAEQAVFHLVSAVAGGRVFSDTNCLQRLPQVFCQVENNCAVSKTNLWEASIHTANEKSKSDYYCWLWPMTYWMSDPLVREWPDSWPG